MKYKSFLKVNGLLFLLSQLFLLLVIEVTSFDFMIRKTVYKNIYDFFTIIIKDGKNVDGWILVFGLYFIIGYLFLATSLILLTLFIIKNVRYFLALLKDKLLPYKVIYNYIILTFALIFDFSYVVFIILNRPKTLFHVYVITSLTLFSLFGIIYTKLIAINLPKSED
jgi:hypothetical protein